MARSIVKMMVKKVKALLCSQMVRYSLTSVQQTIQHVLRKMVSRECHQALWVFGMVDTANPYKDFVV